ncbi:Diphosphoinositol polyphosphate phosphohydrolase 1 [Porphyridium purpureum]|uniref:Diphosphoinositol polyphosphate phosphohydrolase 1 n=1 Tax=Porphyridium purpureum TaxID=35688 RepID=A0A5J4Z6Z4_PORPP|nr:Diphosphoinositol polyphosphate phosphohydrolase 1 [Porphyridium purpureum]|eukprot:POR6994..scf295_1
MTGKHSATALAVQTRGGIPHVLLVSARSKPQFWVLPKGTVEPDERAQDAALREAREEAGVCGVLGAFVGEFPYREGSVMHVWLLDEARELPEEEWAERFQRKRQWFSVCDARKHMIDSGLSASKPEQLHVLDAVLEILQSDS